MREACNGGHVDIADMLLRKGVNIEYTDNVRFDMSECKEMHSKMSIVSIHSHP